MSVSNVCHSNKCHIVEKLYYFVKLTMWDVATTPSEHKAGIKEH